jgi:hypothetical protein
VILAVHCLKYIEDLDVYKLVGSLWRNRYFRRIEVIKIFMKDLLFLSEY